MDVSGTGPARRPRACSRSLPARDSASKRTRESASKWARESASKLAAYTERYVHLERGRSWTWGETGLARTGSSRGAG